MSTYAPGRHPASRKKPGCLARRDRRNQTGCVGVNLTSENVRLAGGRIVTRHYFQANCGARKRRFRIDTLGKSAAFRAAVQWRAQRERAATRPPISDLPTPISE